MEHNSAGNITSCVGGLPYALRPREAQKSRYGCVDGDGQHYEEMAGVRVSNPPSPEKDKEHGVMDQNPGHGHVHNTAELNDASKPVINAISPNDHRPAERTEDYRTRCNLSEVFGPFNRLNSSGGTQEQQWGGEPRVYGTNPTGIAYIDTGFVDQYSKQEQAEDGDVSPALRLNVSEPGENNGNKVEGLSVHLL